MRSMTLQLPGPLQVALLHRRQRASTTTTPIVLLRDGFACMRSTLPLPSRVAGGSWRSGDDCAQTTSRPIAARGRPPRRARGVARRRRPLPRDAGADSYGAATAATVGRAPSVSRGVRLRLGDGHVDFASESASPPRPWRPSNSWIGAPGITVLIACL